MPRIVLTQVLHHCVVSESKKLDVCDLKHISLSPQDDSLVNRWGLWPTPPPPGAAFTFRSGRV